MNTCDLTRVATVKRMKLRNTIGKQTTTFDGIRRKLLIENAAELL